MHRLTSTQYNRVAADLLGTSLRPADFFQAAGAQGFDNNANTLSGISAVQLQGYWDAAAALAADAIASPTLSAAIVTCQPTAAGDSACAREILGSLGLRAWRRPLEAAELDVLVAAYGFATTDLGRDHRGALQHALRVLLASPHFYYRVEREPTAPVPQPRALDGYELASRLAFALAGSMPDAELFAAAASGVLSDPASLAAQVNRLIDRDGGAALITGFFEQWLHLNTLGGHSVDRELHPEWSDGLRAAMTQDARQFLSRFLSATTSFDEMITGALGPQQASSLFDRDPEGVRLGFLGLPAFLTATSMPHRTAPTVRGKVVLASLLCTELPVPDNLEIPPLDEAGGQLAPQNIRKQLEQHRASPDCAACHAILDPIGLGLEHFDAIGRYRSRYENGDPIDAAGIFESRPFASLEELRVLLLSDARLSTCAPERLFTYMLGGAPTDGQRPYLARLSRDWGRGSVRDLIHRTVALEPFLFRSTVSP